jgi:16S rRNA (cytosine1402-N4)-methyltransferase
VAESFTHQSVLLDETARLLARCRRVLDGTAGAGGHSLRLTEAGSEVLALDRDPLAVAAATERLAGRKARVRQLDFVDAAQEAEVRAFQPDGVLLDLGLSSPQIDDALRGFTFRAGAPLDMRMAGNAGNAGNGEWGMGNGGMTAADWLNGADEEDLEHVFKDYGDERRARALVRQIVKRRATRPFRVSDDLVNAIRATLGPTSGPPDFARLFQAVRIAVNGELERLERAVPDLFELLPPGGVIAVIAYHSGEDRIVKHQFRDWARTCVCPEEQPVCTCRNRPLGQLLTRHPIEASDAETARNPRARSAKLRAFRKAA